MAETATPNPPAAVAPPPFDADNYYPKFVVPNNEHPNKLLAIPFLGLFIRAILSIPLVFVFIFLAIWFVFVWIITPFVILFTGKYWDHAYTFMVSYLTYYTKVTLYIYGLTDKYPGFHFESDGLFELKVNKPEKPSRLLAFPLLGFIIRIILLIPYGIYANVLRNGASIALLCSWFGVLIKGKYPESMYEFIRDYIRVYLAQSMYVGYLSDKYPSFHISMNHKNVKITLIVLGAILSIFASLNDANSNKDKSSNQMDYSNFQDYAPQK